MTSRPLLSVNKIVHRNNDPSPDGLHRSKPEVKCRLTSVRAKRLRIEAY